MLNLKYAPNQVNLPIISLKTGVNYKNNLKNQPFIAKNTIKIKKITDFFHKNIDLDDIFHVLSFFFSTELLLDTNFYFYSYDCLEDYISTAISGSDYNLWLNTGTLCNGMCYTSYLNLDPVVIDYTNIYIYFNENLFDTDRKISYYVSYFTEKLTDYKETIQFTCFDECIFWNLAHELTHAKNDDNTKVILNPNIIDSVEINCRKIAKGLLSYYKFHKKIKHLKKRKYMMSKFKKGDKITWTYWQPVDSIHGFLATKTGIFIRYINSRLDVSDPMRPPKALVHLDGNKNPSTVFVSDLDLIKE